MNEQSVRGTLVRVSLSIWVTVVVETAGSSPGTTAPFLYN